MNSADFTWLLGSYIQKYGEDWTIQNIIEKEFSKIGEGVYRTVFRFENFAIKTTINMVGGSYTKISREANSKEAYLFQTYSRNERLAPHFPSFYYLSPLSDILVVEFVDGVDQARFRNNHKPNRDKNADMLARLIKSAGSPAPYIIDDIHYANVLIRNRRRVFIDLGGCEI